MFSLLMKVDLFRQAEWVEWLNCEALLRVDAFCASQQRFPF